MGRLLLTSLVAAVAFTLLLGLAYPLALTGVAQVAFPGRAGGSLIERDGTVVGSKLLAQKTTGRRWFHPRPSQTGYDPGATFFSNRGPNQRSAKAFYDKQAARYLRRERPYDRSLTVADIPVDAVTTSGSGVDPFISRDNAEIQARRVAAVRDVPLARVRGLIDEHTSGRFLGFVGESGVNVTELNLALDSEAR
jgi:K+-transporting ATPase ATPase C chain